MRFGVSFLPDADQSTKSAQDYFRDALALSALADEEEVYQKYLQDFPRLSHLPPPTGAVSIRFNHYSPYFTRAAEYGLDLEPFDFYELVYPWSKESLQRLAYYFEDQRPQPDYRVLANKWLGQMRGHVEQWKRAWLPRGETQMVWGKWYHPNLPKLLFKQQGHETLIHDSCSGKLVRYQIRVLLLPYLLLLAPMQKQQCSLLGKSGTGAWYQKRVFKMRERDGNNDATKTQGRYFFIPMPDGIYFRNNQGSLKIKGQVVYRWAESLAPYLTGVHSLTQITAGLDAEKQTMVTDLINTLLKQGFLKDLSQDLPHGLSQTERASYAAEITLPNVERECNTQRTLREVCSSAGEYRCSRSSTRQKPWYPTLPCTSQNKGRGYLLR